MIGSVKAVGLAAGRLSPMLTQSRLRPIDGQFVVGSRLNCDVASWRPGFWAELCPNFRFGVSPILAGPFLTLNVLRSARARTDIFGASAPAALQISVSFGRRKSAMVD